MTCHLGLGMFFYFYFFLYSQIYTYRLIYDDISFKWRLQRCWGNICLTQPRYLDPSNYQSQWRAPPFPSILLPKSLDTCRVTAVLGARSALTMMNRQSSATMSVHQHLEAATNLSKLLPISDDISHLHSWKAHDRHDIYKYRCIRSRCSQPSQIHLFKRQLHPTKVRCRVQEIKEPLPLHIF